MPDNVFHSDLDLAMSICYVRTISIDVGLRLGVKATALRLHYSVFRRSERVLLQHFAFYGDMFLPGRRTRRGHRRTVVGRDTSSTFSH